MNRRTMKENLSHASLSTPGSGTTLRLRWLMNERQKAEIGERLRGLRNNSPETNRSIGDAVHVSERTVAEWIAGRQGITYEHAQQVAELFSVSLDWFWRGKAKGATPDLLDRLSDPTGELARLSAAVEELQREVATMSNELLSEIEAVRTSQEALRLQLGTAGRAAAGRRK